MTDTTTRQTRPLSTDDIRKGFIMATRGYASAKERWTERAERGLTDGELSEALAYELGIFGGRSGPNEISLTFQAAGLKIWISWELHNHVQTPPTFQATSTIRMAREVYGVADPSNPQMALI